MEINITVKAEDEEAMAQSLDVALFKLGKRINDITRLKLDESLELEHATVSRSE